MKRLTIRLGASLLTFLLGSGLAGLLGPLAPAPAWRRPPANHQFRGIYAQCENVQSHHLISLAEAEPHNASLRLDLGQLFVNGGCYDEAAAAYGEALALDPASLEVYERLANTYNHLSRFREVVSALTEGVKRHPREASLWNELGFAYEGLNRTEDAARAFARAAQLDPENAYARALLAHCYEKLGRRAEAVATARQAITLGERGRDDAAMNNAVMALVALGADHEALAAAHRSAAVDPENPYVHFQYGHLQTLQGQRAEAAASFERVLTAPSVSPTIHLLRGWARLFLGEGELAAGEAHKYLRRTRWKGIDAPRAGLLAYVGYRQAGRADLAQASLAKVMDHYDASLWPYEIARYLQGELTDRDLLGLAADRDELTEAHAFIGIKHSFAGEATRAREHFRWVTEKGTRSFVEYAYAAQELAR